MATFDSHSTLGLFRDLLRIDSRNPGVCEGPIADFIAATLEREGLPATVVEAVPGRKSVFSSLPGREQDKVLLLTAHTDTVPFDEKQWTCPPLGAVEKDGYVYGRGAVDMKHHLAYCLATLIALKRSGVVPRYTIKFSAFADEEQGCGYGSAFIVEHHPELIRATWALNEVGGFPIYFNGRKIFLLATEEKGFAWLRITLRGSPGHGSIPVKDNVLLRIGEITRAVTAQDRQPRFCAATRSFLEILASKEPFPRKTVLSMLRQPLCTNWLLNIALPEEKRPTFYALLHNTYSPTVVATDTSINVVPSTLQLYLDCRIVPGSSVAETVAAVSAALRGQGEIEVIRSAEPVSHPAQHRLFEFTAKRLQAKEPSCEVSPFLTVGFTDNCQLAKLGIQTLGCSPVDLPPEVNFSKLFHGHDERIPVAGFHWGCGFFAELVREIAVEGALA